MVLILPSCWNIKRPRKVYVCQGKGNKFINKTLTCTRSDWSNDGTQLLCTLHFCLILWYKSKADLKSFSSKIFDVSLTELKINLFNRTNEWTYRLQIAKEKQNDKVYLTSHKNAFVSFISIYSACICFLCALTKTYMEKLFFYA